MPYPPQGVVTRPISPPLELTELVDAVCSETEADGKITTHDELASPHSAAGFARLTVAETEVFNGTMPIAWTDLDLSGTIGSNKALVMLKVLGKGNDFVAFRKDGDASQYYVAVDQLRGCAFLYQFTGKYAVVLVATSDTGRIEWIASNATANVTIDIIAFIK